jgi:hypothetical protein
MKQQKAYGGADLNRRYHEIQSRYKKPLIVAFLIGFLGSIVFFHFILHVNLLLTLLIGYAIGVFPFSFIAGCLVETFLISKEEHDICAKWYALRDPGDGSGKDRHPIWG